MGHSHEFRGAVGNEQIGCHDPQQGKRYRGEDGRTGPATCQAGERCRRRSYVMLGICHAWKMDRTKGPGKSIDLMWHHGYHGFAPHRSQPPRGLRRARGRTERDQSRRADRSYPVGDERVACAAAVPPFQRDELFVQEPNGLQPRPRALDFAEPLSLALAQIQRTLDCTPARSGQASTAMMGLHQLIRLAGRVWSAQIAGHPSCGRAVQIAARPVSDS